MYNGATWGEIIRIPLRHNFYGVRLAMFSFLAECARKPAQPTPPRAPCASAHFRPSRIVFSIRARRRGGQLNSDAPRRCNFRPIPQHGARQRCHEARCSTRDPSKPPTPLPPRKEFHTNFPGQRKAIFPKKRVFAPARACFPYAVSLWYLSARRASV